VFATLVARTADIAHTSGLVVLAPMFVVVSRMTDSIVVVVERLEPVLSLVASLQRTASAAPITGNTLPGMVLPLPEIVTRALAGIMNSPFEVLSAMFEVASGLLSLTMMSCDIDGRVTTVWLIRMPGSVNEVSAARACKLR
jgi:hypothetical protein